MPNNGHVTQLIATTEAYIIVESRSKESRFAAKYSSTQRDPASIVGDLWTAYYDFTHSVTSQLSRHL